MSAGANPIRIAVRRVALAALLACLLPAFEPDAFALDPSLDVSQYAHTAWLVRDGFTRGAIRSIAQTPDGYLWLGTEFGLLRFDGVRNVPWQPPPDQHLPSSGIWSLLASRDGTLWIGTTKGLASWKDGRLIQYPELAGQVINALFEDREGAVCTGAMGIPNGKLCAIQKGSIRCFGEDGSLGYGVLGLYGDSKGNLWAAVLNGFWRWRPDPSQFYPMPGEDDRIQGFAESDDGSLLITTHDGIRRFVDGKTEAYPLSPSGPQFDARKLLRDRDGSLWIVTTDRGLIHIHHGVTDVFAQTDGLSGDHAYAVFEDREGNIWVGTSDGLDRFRDLAVATFSAKEGLSDTRVRSVLGARDGSVWFATYGGLSRWMNGRIALSRTGGGKQDGKLNGLNPNSLFQDDRGRIWVSTAGGIGYLENDRYFLRNGVPGGAVHGFAEDAAGNLWIASQDLGLFRLPRRGEIQHIPWARLGRKDIGTALAADPSRGGLWVGFYLGGVVFVVDGEVRASYATADGLGEGRVNSLSLDQDGTLWVATEGGLSRVKGSRVATLSSRNGLPCDGIHWAVEDGAHALWLYMPCGLIRIPRTELDAWDAAADTDKQPKRLIQATVFDSSDGVRNRSDCVRHSPHGSRSLHGSIWF